MCRLILKRRKILWGAFLYLNIDEAKEFLPQPCFKIFPNYNRGLNDGPMSPAQATT